MTQEEFIEGYNQWKWDTGVKSYHDYKHPFFEKIYGAGVDVLPFIFRQMARKPDHWFHPLHQILETANIEGPFFRPNHLNSLDVATDKWLDWATWKGYYDPSASEPYLDARRALYPILRDLNRDTSISFEDVLGFFFSEYKEYAVEAVNFVVLNKEAKYFEKNYLEARIIQRLLRFLLKIEHPESYDERVSILGNALVSNLDIEARLCAAQALREVLGKSWAISVALEKEQKLQRESWNIISNLMLLERELKSQGN